ncbi:MAG: LURP-one-related family protein [Oscillospiraceae bacterium]|nr:LURP-one-related family protein [Oscillospiraceae bacterium]
MKQLFMRQKVFSWKDRFSVQDEFGDDRYYVEGKLFSLGHQLYVMDANGEEVAFVKQKVPSLLSRYRVYVGEEQVAEIVRQFTLLRPRYTIVGPNWECVGNILAHDYEIIENGQTVVAIHKAWLSWGDTYEIDIAEWVDERLALAVVLAIDCVQADQDAAAASSAST